MSGIAGLLHVDGRPVDAAAIGTMIDRLAHRGPDGSDTWTKDNVALANATLRVTPESRHATLPLRAGSLVLVADARIDNRAELLSALGIGDRPPTSVPDEELILRAYEKWAEACVERLVGDFAFAVWDGARRQLVCARDPLGVKPFYYHHRPGRSFAFASEIKGLLALPEVPRKLNELRIADYVLPILEDKESTFYQDIVRLPPAHTLVARADGVRTRCYWRLDPERSISLPSDEAYAETFRELFFEAVRCRLRSTHPVGSLLSGGIDSSSIVCVARGLLADEGRAPLHTFSAVFPGISRSNESEYSDAVIAEGGVEPHRVVATELSPLEDIERVLDRHDEPFFAPNLYLHAAFYRLAERAGVGALLDGIDGDTTLWQRPQMLSELLLRGRWRSLAREIVGLSKAKHLSPLSGAWRWAVRPLLAGPARRVLRRRPKRTVLPGLSLLSPSFVRRARVLERAESSIADGYARSSREDHWRRLTSGLIPFVLEVADREAAARSIEPRYPFFDRRLVEWCLAIPPNQKLRDGYTRAVLRRALAGTLTERVRTRRDKADLSPGFVSNLMGHERPLLERVLGDAAPLAEFIDVPAAQRAYEAAVSRRSSDDVLAVWKVVTLGLWLARGGTAPSSPAAFRSPSLGEPRRGGRRPFYPRPA